MQTSNETKNIQLKHTGKLEFRIRYKRTNKQISIASEQTNEQKTKNTARREQKIN